MSDLAWAQPAPPGSVRSDLPRHGHVWDTHARVQPRWPFQNRVPNENLRSPGKVRETSRYRSVIGEFDHIVAAMNASPLMRELIDMASSGDYSRLDQSKAHRHHFIPQFLLRNFSSQHDGRPAIFQMDTSSQRAPQRVGTRRAASRTKLYTALDENGEPSNRHEGYLALIESHAAPALRRFLDDPTSLSLADRATIAFFLAFQTMRTPAAGAQVTAAANAALQMAAGEMLFDRRAFAERHRQRYGDEISDDEVENLRLETIASIRDNRVRLVGDSGATFSTALEHAAEQVPILYAFHWTLVLAPGGGLVTSDRGYSIHDPTPPFPWAAQGILSSPQSETVVPLSDTATLLLRPGSAGTFDIDEATADDVEVFNLRTYGWADAYVFGRDQTSLVTLRKVTRTRPADVICPRPPAHVVLLEVDPDDASLADANRERGWPARLRTSAGDVRDYVVIPMDEPHPKLWKKVDDLTERRAQKRAGAASTSQLAGIDQRPLKPFSVVPHETTDGY